MTPLGKLKKIDLRDVWDTRVKSLCGGACYLAQMKNQKKGRKTAPALNSRRKNSADGFGTDLIRIEQITRRFAR